MNEEFNVHILWEHYGTLKWIVLISLSRSTAEAYIRNNGKGHDYRIETAKVVG